LGKKNGDKMKVSIVVVRKDLASVLEIRGCNLKNKNTKIQ
jgi:hypothetical protein